MKRAARKTGPPASVGGSGSGAAAPVAVVSCAVPDLRHTVQLNGDVVEVHVRRWDRVGALVEHDQQACDGLVVTRRGAVLRREIAFEGERAGVVVAGPGDRLLRGPGVVGSSASEEVGVRVA